MAGARDEARIDVALGRLAQKDGSEPERQVEIQLGHMCNNRCVFCVSGQRTARGQAGVSPVAPILKSIRDARARGHDKITLLGGEPTLQPGFLEIVSECAALGFSEVVVFTNGAKTASGKLIDEALATGARLSFRISIQGATKESHERTTLKDGSFGRILRSLEHLHARGIKTTVNMCLVASNHEDVRHFAALVLPHGVSQLHVDLMRPRDAGERTEEELAASLAPLDRIGPRLKEMVEGFPSTFDVNVGNLPYCLAPSIADRIHHDGQPTETIAIDGGDAPSAPWDKYENKARDKVKPARCASCAFDAHCTGIYADYLRLQGDLALQPVTRDALEEIDPRRRFLAAHLKDLLGQIERAGRASGLGVSVEHEGLEAVRLSLGGGVFRFVSPGQKADARYERFGIQTLTASAEEALQLRSLLEEAGERPVVPLAGPTLGSLSGPVALALQRLERAAPFGALRWIATRSDRELTLDLRADGGATATVHLALDRAGKVALRYELSRQPSEADERAIRVGLTQLLDALRASARP